MTWGFRATTASLGLNLAVGTLRMRHTVSGAGIIRRTSSRRAVLKVPATGWRYSTHGRIDRVLKHEDYDLTFDTTSDKLLVRPLAAPVTRADIAVVQGSWALDAPTMPAVAGNECVAEVIEVGDNTSGFSKGDLVVPLTPLHGTWATRTILPSAEVVKVARDLPLEYASILGVAPLVAFNLLRGAGLEPGDWVIQNGANGAIGSCLIALAKELGFNTINVVRQRAGADAVVERLVAAGGNLVVTDDYLRRRAFQNLLTDLNDQPIRPKLALNAVGGRVATEMARILAPGGTFRTYGAAARKAVELPVSAMVHNGIRADGYFHPAFIHGAVANLEALQETTNLFSDCVRQKHLNVFMNRFAFDQLPDALAYTLAPAMGRRAILRFEGSPASWDKVASVDVRHRLGAAALRAWRHARMFATFLSNLALSLSLSVMSTWRLPRRSCCETTCSTHCTDEY